jgi:hypothetical protein
LRGFAGGRHRLDLTSCYYLEAGATPELAAAEYSMAKTVSRKNKKPQDFYFRRF